jgi:hypothetical protein
VESAAQRNPDPEFYVSLLHRPQYVQTQVRKYECRNKTSILLFQSNQELVKKRNQGSWVACVCLDNVSKNSILSQKVHLNDPQNSSEGKNDTDKQFQPWNDWVRVCIFQFDLENGDLLLDGVVFGFEFSHLLSESSVGFPFR